MDYQDKALEQADRFHLNAASGWIGLGDLDSASEELAQISPNKRAHPEVLLAQSEYFFAAKKWESVLDISGKLLEQFPKLEFLWINRSYALHELKRTEEAFDALVPAAGKFPKRWLIRYNLACYCSQLGKRAEAMNWLEKAVNLGDKTKIKQMALEDVDFKPLWKEIREM